MSAQLPLDAGLREGLSAPQKRLPSALLYDELGSVLFEAITLLPEYEVARVDTALLLHNAGAALARLGGPIELIELGPGHGKKARIVLEALLLLQARARFFAVDVSAGALLACARALEDLRAVEVTGVEATFIQGLRRLPPRAPGVKRVVLFLGSNLSNFDRRESQQFFRDLRSALQPGDALLLSADLEKAAERLLPAYDDALGVTAAFNKNLLVRLNREYGADFDVPAFVHEARWNAPLRRVEMHLRAARVCEARVEKLGLVLHFAEGETIFTESSHRFELGELKAWGDEAGLPCAEAWVDEAWPLALGVFVAG